MSPIQEATDDGQEALYGYANAMGFIVSVSDAHFDHVTVQNLQT